MQKMTPYPVRPGRTGPQSYRSPELVTCARHLSRATTAAAVEHAGIKTSKKFNTDYIRMILNRKHGGARSRPKIIDKIHDQWCRDNGYPVPKPTSPQAKRRKTRGHKLRVGPPEKSPSPQAPGSRSQGTSGSPQASGYKLPE